MVPFFGDQPFWGERVHARGVGPAPIPVDDFSLDKLVDAIKLMLDPEVLTYFLFLPYNIVWIRMGISFIFVSGEESSERTC